ncbi:hypothetical protein AbraCBS73388_000342 [Aspergillus brasiliensis]|uniref:Metallo-beta-lactamase domain-containing protein n=1 Tax=Aspergillus brasiliensis TaxID=319629 RepID=A0A9W6DIW2_9EURO|nr:hypothetical protein AbraCBS73388_000342 [Aspergillus brasiliensis]
MAHNITIDPNDLKAPTRHLPTSVNPPSKLPPAKESRVHPSKPGGENASIYFIGTATTIMRPNFLHAGDHVHLGPGVSSTRRTNPAVDLEELPRIDLVLLSHYHGDHFDQKVEASLRRDLPIITTPHAKSILTSKGEDSFTRVSSVEVYEQLTVDIKHDQDDAPRQQRPKLRITGMPGKHIPVGKPLEKLNELVGAIPPTNGWMLELGYGDGDSFTSGYRIYISGDTLMFDDLKEIPRRYAGQPIDLMLVHLGGTTVPSPAMLPLAMMVTMDAKQGVELIKLIRPEVTIPIHYDDYDVFASSLDDFRAQVQAAGLDGEVVYLDRGEEYQFRVVG